MEETAYDILMTRIIGDGNMLTKLTASGKISQARCDLLAQGLVAQTIQCEQLKQLTRIADALESLIFAGEASPELTMPLHKDDICQK